MSLIAAIIVLELCAWQAVPFIGDELPNAGRVVSIGLLVLTQLTVVGAAHNTIESDTLWDDIGWLLGAAIILAHGSWHLDLYNSLYLEGDPASIIMVMCAYILMPLAVAMMPLVALPLPIPARYRMRIRY